MASQCLSQHEVREGFRGQLRAQSDGLDLGWLKQEFGKYPGFTDMKGKHLQALKMVLVVTWERGSDDEGDSPKC